MQLAWTEFACLRIDDAVFCHDLTRPYWLWEGIVVSVEPPSVGIYLPKFDIVIFPRLERLHHTSLDPDTRCRYCRAAAGEWAV